MITVVTGSRFWTDAALIEQMFLEYGVTKVIEGGQSGADRLARAVAKRLRISCQTERAKWNTYGHAAGPIRNRVMLNMEHDLVLAFHWDLSQSKGTKDCVEEARRRHEWVVHVRSAELPVLEYGHGHGQRATAHREEATP